ncbi:MAG TPA: PQQ-dependent dehydrogenase, methanol/ethanol family [Usitatibacteraceae bacterium]
MDMFVEAGMRGFNGDARRSLGRTADAPRGRLPDESWRRRHDRSNKLAAAGPGSLQSEMAVRAGSGGPCARYRMDGLFGRHWVHLRVPAIAATAFLLCTVGVGQAAAAETPARVDAARMKGADRDAANWLSYGRTYSEQRFSPLARIDAGNAKELGLAWYADLDTNRGQQATPLVIDGVMYVSTAWSLVKAYDAATGKLLWSYDPEVPRERGVKGCCDVVNRGVAAWKGKIYVGTFDGRLVALDAKTGKPAWSVATGDHKNLTITGAPRVVKGRVIIGMSGGEYGIRGYISAYDAETGKLAWRFYTVPGDPSKPFENKAMEMAAKTWSGEWWKLGGGGTTWDAISYDPALNLVYFGAGNGIEWARNYRTKSKGDNLFTSSIVALNADTGEYAWHYQATPGEEWDFDAVQQLMLADLTIDGKPRKVIMQANKNGFFYVLDRKTGKLISATNFVPVNWASGVDPKTGRPIENPGIRYDLTGKPVNMMPGALGAHSWQPMAYNPKTGLVYIPAQEIGLEFTPVEGLPTSSLGWNVAVATTNTPGTKGYLIAWDPVRRKEVWRASYLGPWNGGTLTTAGNLVMQGDASGGFNAYRADTGEKLWSTPAQSAVMAGPMTYEVNGEQYIAVMSGWGGAFPLFQGKEAAKSGNLRNVSRVLAFKVGGTAALPALPPEPPLVLNPPPATAAADTVAKGTGLYVQYCSVCHGENAIGGGVVPDLRASTFLGNDFFYEIVLNGAMKDAGMAPFKSVLDQKDAAAIQAYLIKRANEDKAAVGNANTK